MMNIEKKYIVANPSNNLIFWYGEFQIKINVSFDDAILISDTINNPRCTYNCLLFHKNFESNDLISCIAWAVDEIDKLKFKMKIYQFSKWFEKLLPIDNDFEMESIFNLYVKAKTETFTPEYIDEMKDEILEDDREITLNILR